MTQKPLEIRIRGGMVSAVFNLPENLYYVVHDYDIDGIDDDELSVDEDGDKYWEY